MAEIPKFAILKLEADFFFLKEIFFILRINDTLIIILIWDF